MTRTIDAYHQQAAEFLRPTFGMPEKTAAEVWRLFTTDSKPVWEPHQLLWVLIFLKLYQTEPVHAEIAGVSQKSFRKWAHYTIEKV